MATRIVMPSFGMYTAEGTVANWLRPDGARVESGEPILEIETDKALNEVIAPSGGILHHVARVGMIIKEEGLLGYIFAEGESIPGEDSRTPTATAHNSGALVSKAPAPAAAGNGLVKVSPLAQRLAKEHGVELATLKGSGPGGRIVEADVIAWVERAKQIPAATTPPVPGEWSAPNQAPELPSRRFEGRSAGDFVSALTLRSR